MSLRMRSATGLSICSAPAEGGGAVPAGTCRGRANVSSWPLRFERRGRAAAALLDGRHGEFERDAARIDNSVFDASGQLEMNAIAWSEIPSRLRDANHGPA